MGIPIGIKTLAREPGKIMLYMVQMQSGGHYLGGDGLARLKDRYKRG
jgi:hypothetical protein